MNDSDHRIKEVPDEPAPRHMAPSKPVKRTFEVTTAVRPIFDHACNLLPRVEPSRLAQPDEMACQSARVLIRRLAQTVTEWRQQIPADAQPEVIAILQGGFRVKVSTLAEESFHGIRIEGTIDDNPCMVLTHQSSVQLLCFVAKVEKEEFRRRIGFIIDGEEKQL